MLLVSHGTVMVEVITFPMGQFVTVGGQEVTVMTCVVVV